MRMPTAARLGAVALAMAAVAVSQRLPSPSHWKTDLTKTSIDLRELQPGGPPKDGIPAIRKPTFVGVEDARPWIDAREPVLVLEAGGAAKIYPIQILIWHELAHDEIGGTPVLASYCPLCNSAIVFDRRVDGMAADFGVSGMLRNSDMIMFDRGTDSLWQQLTGECVAGALTGRRLPILPSQMVDFEAARRAFPAAAVMARPAGADRPYGASPYAGYEAAGRPMFPAAHDGGPLRALDRVVAIESGGEAQGIPLRSVVRSGVRNGVIGGTRYVLIATPTGASALDRRQIAASRAVGSVGAFSAQIDGRALRFRRKGGRVVDRETGSAWDVFGRAVSGPLAGRRLEPLRHGVYYAFAWLSFKPDARLLR